jgi:1-phosphofructokinase
MVGQATGEIVQGLLNAEGIQSEFINTGIETRTNIILVVARKPLSEVRINSKGPKIPPINYGRLYDQCSKLHDAKALAICGSLCYKMEDTFYNNIIATVRKNNPECVVILDGPENATVEAMVFPTHRPDFIKPNLIEFHRLLQCLDGENYGLYEEGEENDIKNKGISLENYLEHKYTGITLEHKDITIGNEWKLDEEKLKSNWNKLLNRVVHIKDTYKVTTILSLGALGCISVSDEEGKVLHSYIPEKLEVLTRVGAGDCLVAGFLSEYTKNSNIKKALEAGIAAASARISVEEYTADGKVSKYLDLNKFKEMKEKVCIDSYNAGETGQQLQFLDNIPEELSLFSKLKKSQECEKDESQGRTDKEEIKKESE